MKSLGCLVAFCCGELKLKRKYLEALTLTLVVSASQYAWSSPCEGMDSTSADYQLCTQFHQLKLSADANQINLEKSAAFKLWQFGTDAVETLKSRSEEWTTLEKNEFFLDEVFKTLEARPRRRINLESAQLFLKRISKNSIAIDQIAKDESSLYRLIGKINKEVSQYANPSSKIARSPLEFAISIYKESYLSFGSDDASLQLARGLTNLVLRNLGFPNLPIRDSGLLTLEGLQLEYQQLVTNLNRCVNQPVGLQQKNINQRLCQPFYIAFRGTSDQALVESLYTQSMTELLKDLIRFGSVFPANENTSERLMVIRALQHFRVRTRFQIPLSVNEKRKFFEMLADPLVSDLRTWSWVTGRGPAISRSWIYSNPYLFNRMILGETCETGSMNFCGAGLYVSRNPFDSAEYGLSAAERNALETPSAPSENGKLGQARSRGADSLHGILFLVTINKGQRVLDYKVGSTSHFLENQLNEESFNNRSILYQLGIDEDDPYKLNPNLVIDYSPGENEWMNIKLRPSEVQETSALAGVFSGFISSVQPPFELKEAVYSDFNAEELLAIRARLASNDPTTKITIARQFFEQILSESEGSK